MYPRSYCLRMLKMKMVAAVHMIDGDVLYVTCASLHQRRGQIRRYRIRQQQCGGRFDAGEQRTDLAFRQACRTGAGKARVAAPTPAIFGLQ